VAVALYENRVIRGQPPRCFMEPLVKLWMHDIEDRATIPIS